MKRYLMTWYGITDFRSSLGQEKTTGPVLGALLAEDYTDVVILGFTNSDKTKVIGLNEKDVFQEKLAEIEHSEPAEARQFLDLFSNTEEAHRHFTQWLQKQLQDADKKVAVRFHPVDLKHLNDTEGIYDAATQSLNSVSIEKGAKQVTLYLSPGTPVMAFVWAFAALRHPNLKKRLIASSQADKPPETIVLPNEWLEWHGRQVKTLKADPNQYDIIFHLFGEQRMPNLLGVLQFSSKKHVFVNSKQFPADVMKQFMGDAEYGEIAVDPYDPENVRTTILNLIAKMSSNINIGFNLTGGTKLMYAGALAACRKVNATPFYFDSRNNKVIFLNDFASVDTKQISSVETFIKLNGNNLFISKNGCWGHTPDMKNPERTALTKQLWRQRSTIARLYTRIAPFNDKPGVNFQFSHKHISVELKEKHRAEIILTGSDGKKSTYRFFKWHDFARYLSGGWFEEYVYIRLHPFLASGLIKDLRLGLEVSFKEDSSDTGAPSIGKQLSNLLGETYQELDITFTDGKRLYIIECKAGSVKGVQVRKLESVTRYFGGIESRGILACCFPPRSNVVKQKAHEAHNVQLMAGNYLFEELEALIYRIGVEK